MIPPEQPSMTGPSQERRPLILVAADDRPIPTPYGRVRWHGLGDAYFQAVRDAGGFAVIAPVGQPGDAQDLACMADGLLLVGGGDLCPESYGQRREAGWLYDTSAERDVFEQALLTASFDARLPVLGICRGCQLANVWAGGSLHQNLGEDTTHWDVDRPNRDGHAVDVRDGSLLSSLVRGGRVDANSLHHQAIDRIGEGLVVVGRAEDGVVEALEHQRHADFLAVQWHPEMVTHNPAHAALFHWLIERAAEHRSRRTGSANGVRATDGDAPR